MEDYIDTDWCRRTSRSVHLESWLTLNSSVNQEGTRWQRHVDLALMTMWIWWGPVSWSRCLCRWRKLFENVLRNGLWRQRDYTLSEANSFPGRLARQKCGTSLHCALQDALPTRRFQFTPWTQIMVMASLTTSKRLCWMVSSIDQIMSTKIPTTIEMQ